jgi:hypothetical protein
LGVSEVQKAARSFTEGDTLDRAYFVSRFEVVRSLADGGAAWFHDGSRVNREVQVRFWESLAVRFPGATHLVALAKQMGTETIEFIESRLEGKFQLS